MARRTFFSFHYALDIWRASVVRNSGKVDAQSAAGWEDASLWEDAKVRGRNAIQRLIDDGLNGTSVTVVLIGEETHEREFVDYEIQSSLERGNGLVGIFVHEIRDQNGDVTPRGKIPTLLSDNDVPCYGWNRKLLGVWVEQAAIRAGRPCLRHKSKNCKWCRLWLWLLAN